MKGIKKFIKVYPWYSGLTVDLLFYVAIDTLFLTIVKNLSPSQILSLNSISKFVCLALQFPCLYILKQIGNTASIKTSAFLLLLSSVLITFGGNYYLVLLGRIFHDIAAIFHISAIIALKNNLDIIDKQNDFVHLRAAANTIYSIFTMLISFIASYIFNLNHYLPMIGCITFCLIGFILSLFMKDYSDYNKTTYKKQKKVKIDYSKLIIIAIIFYALFYSAAHNSQTDGKLFIQQQLLLNLNVDNTSLIIGIIVCISRFTRVISNILFARLYYKYHKETGIALSVMLSFSITLMLFGSLIPQLFIKLIVMAIGYPIILFVRDPFKIYMHDIIFKNTPKEQHQTLLTMLEFGDKLVSAGIGLIFSAILINNSMKYCMVILLVLTIINVIFSIRFYKIVLQNNI